MDNYLNQLNKMYNDGEITLSKKTKLYADYKNSGQMDSEVSLKMPESKKVEVFKKNKISVKKDISDRELQEQILKTLKMNQADNRSIKKWVTFWSWLYIISIIIYIFYFLVAN